MSKISFLVLSLIIVFVSCTDNVKIKTEQIKELVSKGHETGLFNGTVLVAHQDEVIFRGAFGYKDLESKTPLTTNSAFYLASVSKQFTTMAIMILKEKGKLSYDDTLDKYFPQFPDYAKSITIRHLMTHTSAIPDHFSLFNDPKGITNDDVLEKLIQVKELSFMPGEKFSYSNGGFVLLSLIVGKVSGQPFHVFMKNNIFDPLGMIHTLVYDTSEPEVTERVTGYNLFGEKNDYTLFTSGAGGMYTTVEDLYRWDRALLTDKLVKQETLDEAFTPFIMSNDTSTGYGFGWTIVKDERGKRVQHSGGLAGFSTYIERHLDQKYTIIFLNSRGIPLRWLSDGIRNILNDRPYQPPKTPIALKMDQLLAEMDISKAIEQYHMLKEQETDHYEYDEGQLNRYGYYLLSKKRNQEAIEIFKLNVSIYPSSTNVYDSLGDGYAANQQLEQAAENYRLAYQKALETEGANVDVYKKNLDRVLKQIENQ